LIFQTLDDKKHCVGIYADSQIHHTLPDNLTHTWSYAAFLADMDIEYASLYCEGKTMEQVVPEQLKPEWDKISGKMKAFLKAFTTAKINLRDVCFYDMVPVSVLLEWCDVKSKICHYIFENYEKPANYDFLVDLTKLATQIKHQKLNVDLSPLKSTIASYRSRSFINKINQSPDYIDYNIFGTITGRLSTHSNSFPIMTMDKKYRKIVKPQNDWLVELDYNAAELRTFLALNGKDQPQEDLHGWNTKNLFKEGTRDEAKIRLFSWLYNPKSKDYLLDEEYDRKALLHDCYDDQYVVTPYGRTIRAVPRNALNYLIQSTTSDLFLRQVIKINEILKDTGSFISWTLHDSVMIDLRDEEKPLLPQIIDVLGDTKFGKYVVNVSAGSNYGEMKKIK